MINNQKGFTLVELIVVLVLMGLAIVIVIQAISWANQGFNKSKEQSILYTELRAEANYITNQIRQSKEIEVMVLDELTPESFESNSNFIYIKDGAIEKKINEDSSQSYPMVNEVKVSGLLFTSSQDGLIRFSIIGELGEKQIRTYTIDSSVLADRIENTLMENEGEVLRFKFK